MANTGSRITSDPTKPCTSRTAISRCDWDATSPDTYHSNPAPYLAACQEMGIPSTLEDRARLYSPNGYAVYRAARLPRSRWDEANRAWRRQYASHKPKLIAGVRRVL